MIDDYRKGYKKTLDASTIVVHSEENSQCSKELPSHVAYKEPQDNEDNSDN
jgi:hypothetical protein